MTPTPELEAWLMDQIDFPTPTEQAMGRDIEDRILKVTEQAPPGYNLPPEVQDLLDSGAITPESLGISPTTTTTKPTNKDGSRKGSQSGKPTE